MADILIDPPATYAATAVLAATPKINNTPRIPSDADTYSIAQYADEIDLGLIGMNSWLLGSSNAGAVATTIGMIGSLSVDQNFEALGTGAIGDTSGAGSLTFKASNADTFSLFFADNDSPTVGGIIYNHSTNEFTVNAGALGIFTISSVGLVPSSHVAYDFGTNALRWRKLWIDQLDVSSSAHFGTGATAFNLQIDGGIAGGQESKLEFAQAGVAIAGVRLTSAADIEAENTNGGFLFSTSDALTLPRLTSAERTGLTDSAGKIVYDTTTDRVYFNNGSGWLVNAMQPIDLSRSNSILPVGAPAVAGELGGTTPVLYYADALDLSAFWLVQIPDSYAGASLTLRLWWSGVVGLAANVAWQWSFERFQSGDDMTLNGSNTPATSFVAGPAVAQQLQFFDRVFTNGDMDGIAAGDLMRVTLSRIGTDLGDLYTSSAAVLGMRITQ